MKIYTLVKRHAVRRTPEEVFDFYNDPHHLEAITPSQYRLKVLTPKPVQMHIGTTLDYTIRFCGIPFRWTSLITEYERGRKLVEVQLKGIFAFWHHQYTFEPKDGETRITELVLYAVPFGVLGWLAHRMFVERLLNGIFDYRYSVLGHIFPKREKKQTS